MFKSLNLSNFLSLKSVKKLKLQQYNLSSFIRMQSSSVNTKFDSNIDAKQSVLEIPHSATILIGGYLTHQVPSALISILSQAQCCELTLITNVSVLEVNELKSLFKIHGKVKRLVTSLEFNRSALLDCELKNYFELNVLNAVEFTHKYCLRFSGKNIGEYALVKAKYVDSNRNLLWHQDTPNYFNKIFAQSALGHTIAQVEPSFDRDDPEDANTMKKVDLVYIKNVLFKADSKEKSIKENNVDLNNKLIFDT